MSIESRLGLLKSQLREATEKINKAERSVKRAEKKLEDAEYLHDCIVQEIDRELINSWNGNPDWNILLEDSELHSTLLYEYTNSLFERMGVNSCCKNINTKQRAVNIFFETTSDDELMKKERAVAFLSNYITSHKGKKSFSVSNTKEDDCAYGLVIDSDERQGVVKFYVEKMTWGSVDHSSSFHNLNAALRHIQLNVCSTDLIPDQDFLEINHQ
ncbi:hypothetical protein [Erwinia mallotivora]|uniref:hypothetical protein n=1 Tax=Erwinia mallotivora TaxID=69222 RepID=UPI0021BE8E5E|nr:hypothetical protein [Erwinia mallotivora]